MSETSHKPIPSLSVDEGVDVLLSKAQQSIRHRYQECERQVRKSPTTSLLVAVAAGYCLHRLPVRAIVVTQVRLLAALAPPALLLFGAAKVIEFLQHQDSGKSR